MVSVEAAGVVAQILPVAFLVVAFESRYLRYLTSPKVGVKVVRWTYAVASILVVGITPVAEYYLVRAVVWNVPITSPATLTLLGVTGAMLGGLAGAFAVLAVISNMDDTTQN